MTMVNTFDLFFNLGGIEGGGEGGIELFAMSQVFNINAWSLANRLSCFQLLLVRLRIYNEAKQWSDEAHVQLVQ